MVDEGDAGGVSQNWKNDERSGPVGSVAEIEELMTLARENPGSLRMIIDAMKMKASGEKVPASTNSGPKRAICLGGGGPAAGLHIGALEGLADGGVTFDTDDSVWALACIGAWVGVIYNQVKAGDDKIKGTYKFFLEVFRDNKVFESFPANTVFTPDWLGNAEAIFDFILDPHNYKSAFLPKKIMESFVYTMSHLTDLWYPGHWRTSHNGHAEESHHDHGGHFYRGRRRPFSEGDFNRWTLNHVLAVNPAVRFLTGMIYKSKIDGRSRLYYPDSSFLNHIKFDELKQNGKPYLFYNAFNLQDQEIDLFGNRWKNSGKHRKKMSPESLCACSALPWVEQTVAVDGDAYCEGALVDCMNFRSLMEDHGSTLKEIWINRILDTKQVHKPENLHDSLANLCQLFAASLCEKDIELFKRGLKNEELRKKLKWLDWSGIVVQIPVFKNIKYTWSHKNLEEGRAMGREMAHETYKLYDKYKTKTIASPVLIIPDDLSPEELANAGAENTLKLYKKYGGFA